MKRKERTSTGSICNLCGVSYGSNAEVGFGERFGLLGG